MAHEIGNTDKFHAFDGRDAWHGLGTIELREGLSFADAITAADINWNAVETPLYLPNGNEVETHKAIVRSDNSAVLGIHGNGYSTIQYADFAKWLDTVFFGQVETHTMGTLRGGARFFACGKVSEDITVAGDTWNHYVVGGTSHDGSEPVYQMLTSVRAVCANTVGFGKMDAKANGLYWQTKHTRLAEIRMSDAREMLKVSIAANAAECERYGRLAEVQVSTGDVEQFIAQLFGDPNAVPEGRGRTIRENKATMLRSVLSRPTNAEHKGTAYALANATLEYIDWDSTVRTRGDDSSTAGERRLERRVTGTSSVEFGEALKVMTRAIPATASVLASN